MNNLYEMIQKADNGDPEAQFNVASYIVWGDQREPIEPDWLERALDYFKRAAAQGYGDAMLDLGVMFRVGRGVSRDMEKSFYWFNQAAAILHPKAFRYLGYALEIPLGYSDINDAADQDGYKTAFGYFFKGAMLNEQNSIYKLGDMYFTGKYVDIDQRFAFKLYQESYDFIEYIDDDSYASVCLRLGECYCKGLGTEQDLSEARDYLQRAIEGYEIRKERGDDARFFMEGFNKAKHLLKRIDADKIPEKSYDADRSGVTEEYSHFINSNAMRFPEPQYPIPELEELKAENPVITDFNDEGLTFEHILHNAEAGNMNAMYQIAFYCFNRFEDAPGKTAIRDFSLYYYHYAIRLGHRDAMYNLGSIYYHGNSGVPIDRQKAYHLYSYANVNIAQGELGVYYAAGEIVEQNYETAFKCFAKCALEKLNICYGSFANLAQMYRRGYFVESDEKFAEYLKALSEKAKKAIVTEDEV